MSRARTLPLADWPAADRTMWDRLIAAGGLLDDAGPLSGVRESTRASLLVRYRRWLGWLAHVEPNALEEPPEARATAERMGRWVEDLSHTAPMSRLAMVDGLLRVLSAAAPSRDWSRQERLRAVLRRRARHDYGARKAGRVLSSAVLLEAGLRHAGAGAAAATTPLEAAKRCRDGAMIATLAALPMRRRAFASLAVGRSLEIGAQGMHVHLSPDMTKNGRPWSAPVPNVLTDVLRRYLDEARPALLARADDASSTDGSDRPDGLGGAGQGAQTDALWITDRGIAYHEGYLSVRIGIVTQKLLGVRVSPHLFRDAAATTLSRASPQNARLIRPLLAHAAYGTAERHYVHAGHIEAGRDYATLIDTITGAK